MLRKIRDNILDQVVHCTAFGLRGLEVHEETHPAVQDPIKIVVNARIQKSTVKRISCIHIH